jgi:hypothetical protein
MSFKEYQTLSIGLRSEAYFSKNINSILRILATVLAFLAM